jgi:hypothetical protein
VNDKILNNFDAYVLKYNANSCSCVEFLVLFIYNFISWGKKIPGERPRETAKT